VPRAPGPGAAPAPRRGGPGRGAPGGLGDRLGPGAGHSRRVGPSRGSGSASLVRGGVRAPAAAANPLRRRGRRPHGPHRLLHGRVPQHEHARGPGPGAVFVGQGGGPGPSGSGPPQPPALRGPLFCRRARAGDVRVPRRRQRRDGRGHGRVRLRRRHAFPGAPGTRPAPPGAGRGPRRRPHRLHHRRAGAAARRLSAAVPRGQSPPERPPPDGVYRRRLPRAGRVVGPGVHRRVPPAGLVGSGRGGAGTIRRWPGPFPAAVVILVTISTHLRTVRLNWKKLRHADAGGNAAPCRANLRGVLRMTLKVRDVYTRKVIWVTPNSTLPEARKLMDGNDIRRLPAIAGGELVGIITLTDVLRAAPSPATSLSVWEINYLLDKITVAELMTSPVMTVTPETPLHEVARLMLAHKIGGLPVVEDGKVVGMITESDIFRVMVGLLGGDTEELNKEAEVEDAEAAASVGAPGA